MTTLQRLGLSAALIVLFLVALVILGGVVGSVELLVGSALLVGALLVVWLVKV